MTGIAAFRHIGKPLVVCYDGHLGESTKEDMKGFDAIEAMSIPRALARG